MMIEGKNQNSRLSKFERTLIERIALRVSDNPQCKILEGSPRTDGKKIFLPFKESNYSYSDFEGLAAHEGGHIRFHSLIDPTIPQSISTEWPQLAQVILNICEDARIEWLLNQTFPGFWDELDTLNARFLADRVANISEIDPKLVESGNEISILIEILSYIGTQHEEFIFNPAFYVEGSFKWCSPQISHFYSKCQLIFHTLRSFPTFSGSIIAAKEIFSLVSQFIKTKSPKSDPLIQNPKSAFTDRIIKNPEDKSSDNYDESKIEKKIEEQEETNIDHPLSSINIDDLLKKYKHYRESSGIPVSGLKKDHKVRYERIKHAISSISIKMMESLTQNSHLEPPVPPDILTDLREEFDLVKESVKKIELDTSKAIKNPTNPSEIKYINKKIRVEVFSEEKSLQMLNKVDNPMQIYSQIVSSNRVLIQQLQYMFQKFNAKQILHRGARHGQICGRDLAQVRIGQGSFITPFKMKKDTQGAHILILIDESGSMDGRPISIAKKTVIILAEALRNTQIHFAVIGFGAKHGKEIICEKIYKNFHEQFPQKKLGLIEIAHSFIENRDGDSIRSAIEFHLKNLVVQIPILIIISDGQPCHGGTGYQGSIAIQDTHKAVHDLQKSHVRIFAFSIDTTEKTYLQQIYGKSSYEIIKNLDELPDRIINFISRIAQTLSRS